MSKRQKILFRVNDEIVVEQKFDLFLNQIDEIKWALSLEFEVEYDDVCVEFVDIDVDLDVSDEVDITPNGLIFWKESYDDLIKGVKCNLIIGSDEYLDAILNGTIDEHLIFFI